MGNCKGKPIPIINTNPPEYKYTKEYDLIKSGYINVLYNLIRSHSFYNNNSRILNCISQILTNKLENDNEILSFFGVAILNIYSLEAFTKFLHKYDNDLYLHHINNGIRSSHI